jgi:hypothetical protein
MRTPRRHRERIPPARSVPSIESSGRSGNKRSAFPTLRSASANSAISGFIAHRENVKIA